MRARDSALFAPPINCWQVARAARAAVLVDAAAYYGALRSALLQARESVFILGWDIDSRVELRGEAEPDDGAPLPLRALLNHLVARRPGLVVRLLPWDYSMLFVLEREPLPEIMLDWATSPAIKVCLDDVLPFGGSHHQKLVVVDDCLAFSGGLDLTIRRWDTSAHAAEHPLRRDPSGMPYPPFHDVQMCVDGPAAAALAVLARQRWRDAACERPPFVRSAGDPWPDGLRPDFRDVDVALARTLPDRGNGGDVREVEALHLDAIDRARRRIYIENQFLTAELVARRLAARLRQVPELEVVIVSPADYSGWVEAQSMTAGRVRFAERLRRAAGEGRVRLLHPVVADAARERRVMVHAKVTIVDDWLLRVGSANLNNRSMGYDSELDLAIEAVDAEQRLAVAAVRNRLLAEHLGVTTEAVAARLSAGGSLIACVDALGGGPRGLRPIRDDAPAADAVSATLAGIADPERPIAASRIVGGVFVGEPAGRSAGRMIRLFLAGGAILAAAALWNAGVQFGLFDVHDLAGGFATLESSGWAALLVPLVFVVGSLAVVPVTLLIGLTAVAFTPWSAFLYAGTGALASAAVNYWLGARLCRGTLRQRMGPRLNRISRALADKGVLSVMAIRMLPIAPFTVVNLAAGASHVRFPDYIAGTVLGMAPGILAITVLGHQFARTLASPGIGEIALLSLAVTFWIAASLGLQALILRTRHRA